eukprot:TRINITY_DN117368_c0_g1_i1.p1 TRINITY_DN117368_c0_g1~~TRINITY_DN117368_c0_g1_i1.p1  ORF type:complete len:133 (+),score=9.99 TRINITY_DN117368_c0_g1_i1:30-428(+)
MEHVINEHELEGIDVTDDEYNILLNNALERYWTQQIKDVEILDIKTEQEFKNHNDLPLARIKRIMKSDEDVRMISAEAPVLFAKACEMFVLEISLRAWYASEKAKRKTMQREDIDYAISQTEIFDFLAGLQP